MNAPIEVPPFDNYNRQLVANAHPAAYVNPRPARRYNLVVIGGGTAGLVSAIGAAGLGAKVALIEKHLTGGDCLVYGCVPSKAVIRSSRVLAELRNAALHGVEVDRLREDFGRVMERMRRARAMISEHDSAMRIRQSGVDLYFGEPRFTGRNKVLVDGVELRFKRAAITTGARAVRLPVTGAESGDILTNETFFNLTQLPARLAVIGAGPLGCEMAQAFARLGSQVTLIHKHANILNKEDPDAAGIVQRRFANEGIHMIFSATVERLGKKAGSKELIYTQNGNMEKKTVRVDAVLAGVGRAPNVAGLNLEAAGVAYDARRGVKINKQLQTTNPAIYAAGDVALQWKFTHAADASARLLIQNALFGGKKKFDSLIMPWCTFTDPEIAHVGMYERQAAETGVAVETYTESLTEVDRAIVDGQANGFARIHVKKGTDRILGATIVAANAGSMISEITAVMNAGAGLKTLAKTIHPYPTQAEVLKSIADSYSRTRLKSWMKSALVAWFAIRR